MITKINILLALYLILCTAQVNAEPIIWEIQSSKFADTTAYKLEQQFSKRVSVLTDNELILKILPPGGYVETSSTFNSVRTRNIDGMFMQPQYWANADPVFSVMGDLVAAWNDPEEYNDWLIEGNGIKYLHETYNRFGLTLVNFVITPHESLVSTKPIRNIQDFVGKRMRTPPGMVADYFSELGALTRQIAASRVEKALARNQISLSDFADIIFNESVGLYQQAKYTNYPGFHSLSFFDFVVNTTAWNELTAAHKKAVNLAIEEWKVSLDYAFKMKIEEVLNKLKKEGVTVHHWSDEDRKKARKRAVVIWHKYAEKSERSKVIINSLIVKLKEIGNL